MKAQSPTPHPFLSTVKAVVFDLGKVLVDFDYVIAVRRIAGRSRLAPEALTLLLNQSPLLLQYETGLLTNEEFYEQVCAATGFCGDFDEFGLSFGDIFTPIEPMVELHRALRNQGLSTYILSNTNELAVRHIRRSFPFFSQFDGYIFSYQHRAMKPDSKLYEVVERESGRRGSELLYIDDRAENLTTAAARGWHVILQENPATTVAAIRELGLSVPPLDGPGPIPL